MMTSPGSLCFQAVSPDTATKSETLADVQRQTPAVHLRINRVGIRGITLPVLLRQRDNGETQRTVANISLSVDLPAHMKGTHMSRFVETLQNMVDGAEELDYAGLRNIMRATCERLNADHAYVTFSFPYFFKRPAPATGKGANVPYMCTFSGEIDRNSDQGQDFLPFMMEVVVPVMTVCPCSKAISSEGAHSQRADIHISACMKGHMWIEDLIELAEKAGSSPVYSLLKREDEKYVTEHAFAQPRFVEDVVRYVAKALEENPLVSSFRVEVQSHESIHAHDAFALIEGGEIKAR